MLLFHAARGLIPITYGILTTQNVGMCLVYCLDFVILGKVRDLNARRSKKKGVYNAWGLL